jgi:hypothetical protein
MTYFHTLQKLWLSCNELMSTMKLNVFFYTSLYKLIYPLGGAMFDLRTLKSVFCTLSHKLYFCHIFLFYQFKRYRTHTKFWNSYKMTTCHLELGDQTCTLNNVSLWFTFLSSSFNLLPPVQTRQEIANRTDRTIYRRETIKGKLLL